MTDLILQLTAKFFINNMSKHSLIFYISSALLSIALFIYLIYIINVLVAQVAVMSNNDLLKVPEIATFNLEKFNELKIAQ